MVFLTLDCIYSTCCTFSLFFQSLKSPSLWPVPISRSAYLFGFLMFTTFSIVLFVFVVWHLWLIGKGQTQLEWTILKENDYTNNSEGRGWKQKFQLFFNTEYRPWFYIFLPIRVPPHENTCSINQ
ncbi:hypothetical protein HMI54_002588 [Coelomomyces lativittatus]|nr:hypothetical protein HMI54_002588 [Coelomomyces lativittatus]